MRGITRKRGVKTSLVITCNHGDGSFLGVRKLPTVWLPIPTVPPKLDSDSLHVLMLVGVNYDHEYS